MKVIFKYFASTVNTHVTQPFSLLIAGFFHAVLTGFTRFDGSLDMTLFHTMKHILPYASVRITNGIRYTTKANQVTYV